MMKNINIKFWIAIFISIIAVRTHAQTYEANFSISDFEIAAGETKVVEVSMTSKEENIRGFQVTITIPQELTFVRVSGTEARPKFAALNYSRAPGDEGYTITTTANMGSIKSAVIASKNDDGYPYYGTSGTIFTFAVKASDDIIAGKHNIKFSDIEIVKEENISINPIDIVVTATVLPTGVSLSKNSTSIMEGNTETLSAELFPGNVAAGSELSWKSSDEKVATVSNGVITAVSVGNATITVTTSNGKTATCSVTVTEDVNKTANSFKTTHATILSKTTTTVTSADLVAINAALEDYDKLSSGSKTKLATEKSKLDSLKNKAEELKATEEAVAKFKSDNAGILGKTTVTVASSDLSAINKALDDYSKLSEAAKAKVTTQKTLLDNLKAKAEEIKAAEDADAAATAEANKFKSDNASILGKTTANVASADLSSINKALDDYSKLSEAAKAKVATQKTLLDALKTKAEEIKAAEDADAAATAEANKFKSDNASILGKTTANVASADLSAISKALDDYSKLSEAAKAKVATQKTLLDNLKTKAEEIKAAEDADAAATAEANKFKSDNATILGKTTANVASADLSAISKALDDYSKLSEAAKAKLATQKTLLDNLEAKAEEIKAAEDADAAATAEANKFKSDNATILSKTTATVASTDLSAINKALDDYSKLSDAAKAKVATQKTLLDNLKAKAEEIKAAEDADAAATAEANKFKSDNATILSKTTATVASTDLSAINKALDDYSKLSDAAKAKVATQKTLLDNLKAKAEEIKAAEDADAAATAEANKFKSDNATILSKTTATVASTDLSAINKALDDYSKLSDAAKAKVATQKTLLDALKTKAEEIKAIEDAVAKFKSENAEILEKTTTTVASSDLPAIDKALEDYGKLSEAVKVKLMVEKNLLDKLKSKAEELKAAEEADAAATAEANKFKSDNATILGKTTATVTSEDLSAISKALDEYSKLSEAAKAKATSEKTLLDELKAKAEEIKAIEDVASKFKSDNADILNKTTSTVTSSDLAAINKALEDYNLLSDAAKAKVTTEKSLLDNLKTKAEELKAAEEADAAATEEAEKFKTDNAEILSKTTATVASVDLPTINLALDYYDKLSDAAKAKLTDGEKDLLDALKTKAEELKASEDADAVAAGEAEKFKADNAEILGKTIDTVSSSDLPAITFALDYYDKLSDAAKAKLTGGEKDLLDNLKAKAEELKAVEDADAAATAEADKFKKDNATILGKSTSTVTSSDIEAIKKALDDYGELSDAAKEKLTGDEKTLLDDLKSKAEELKAAEDADAAATAEADKFKKDNATILGKSTSTVTSSDIEAIKKALDDYGKLSDAAKEKLTDGEKTKLDSLKEKAEELKAEEEADAAAEKEADDFYDNHADILTKTVDEITADDKDAIDKALEDYDKLSDAAKDKLTNGEKALLDSLKDKVESIITSISNVSSYYDNEKWYDLSGKVVNKGHKGFAIINGKKVFIK